MSVPPAPSNGIARIKLMTVGSSGVGKSCLIKRYCEGRFISKYIPTIGIDYGVKRLTVDQARRRHKLDASASTAPLSEVRVSLWDSAGDAAYAEVRNEFYQPAQGILLVYDVHDSHSFTDLDSWWNEMAKYLELPAPSGASGPSPQPSRASQQSPAPAAGVTAHTTAGRVVGSTAGRAPVVVLCANKVDDLDDQRRVISRAEGEAWAAAHGGLPYFEMSASSGENVADCVESLCYAVLDRFM